MTEIDLKRFSMAEIEKMIEAGQYFPIPADAPEIDVDESFWKRAKQVVDAESTTSVQLELKSSTVDRFRQSGPDALARMAKILNDYVEKAS